MRETRAHSRAYLISGRVGLIVLKHISNQLVDALLCSLQTPEKKEEENNKNFMLFLYERDIKGYSCCTPIKWWFVTGKGLLVYAYG